MKISDARAHLGDTSQAYDCCKRGDLGLGDKVARQPATRLINPVGTFKVSRRGPSIFAPYKNLVEMSWSCFRA